MWLACLRGVLPEVRLEEGGQGDLRIACRPHIWGAWALGRGAQSGAGSVAQQYAGLPAMGAAGGERRGEGEGGAALPLSLLLTSLRRPFTACASGPRARRGPIAALGAGEVWPA